MSEHDSSHFLDRIEAYLADGLTPDERAAFEAHAAACPTCGAALAQAVEADREIRGLFEGVRPSPGFEDRLVGGVRLARAPRRRLIHPMVLRSAAAVAAAVLLTGAGLVVSQVMEGKGNLTTSLAMGESSRAVQQLHLNKLGKALALWSESDGDGTADPGLSYSIERPSKPGAGRALGWTASRSPETFGEQTPGVRLLTENGADRRGDANAPHEPPQSSTPQGLGNEGKPGVTDTFDSTKGLSTYGFRTGASADGASASVRHAGAGEVTWGLDQKPAADDYSLSFKPATQLGRQSVALNGQLGDANGTTLGVTPMAAEKDAKQLSELERPPSGAPAATLALAAGDKAPEPAAEPPKQAPPPPANAAPSATSPAPIGRKVIRNGTIEFEVDRFDDAVMRITKLVTEQDGFIATTDSDKLPNGHMKGTLTVRVPPERLDTLILTLRGIGDLKSQKIGAEDVTKHYTDLDSQLRAARAMEERLLAIIKSGNGQIKDLLAAEKELGIWREKIEAIEGEKRYLDNQVSLSTLVISLFEKDIHTPASASETEQVQMSLETEAVDDAYNKALEAIKSAKGRITQSELKQYDAGQFGATVVAAVPPDAAEAVIARLRQLNGRIAHFSRDRHQTTKDGAPPPAAVTQVQREDTIVSLQIYNLANIAPRRTTTLQVATNQVDRAYAQVIEQVRSAGGRIVTSSLAKPDPNTQMADLDFQVPTEKTDAMLDALRAYGEVMHQELSENPDTANVTEAKRGIHLRLVSLAAVPARETQTLQLAAANVPAAFNDILNAAKAADARVFQSDLSEQNPQDITAAITIEVPRSAAQSIDAAIGKATQVLTRTINRSTELDKTVDTKLRLSLSLLSADRLPPRQTTAERVEVTDVERAADDLVNAAAAAGGRRIGTGEMSQDRAGHVTSQVVVEVPLNKAGPILDELERAGSRRSKQVSFDTTVPDGPLARARIDATFSNSATSLGGEESTWDAIRHGLAVSGKGLRWSLQMLVVGFCFVAPWVLVLWLIWRVIRRSRSRPAPAPSPTPAG